MNAFDKGKAGTSGSRRGIVAAAVLRAASLSARMSKAFMARTSGVSEDTIQSWEDGTTRGQPRASPSRPGIRIIYQHSLNVEPTSSLSISRYIA